MEQIENNWTLSKQIHHPDETFDKDDVKEFIKRLKEEIYIKFIYWSDESIRLKDIINKLAGEKLI